MVSTAVLFDTNILIDYLKGISAARAECERYTDRAISVVTWMEVMAGSTSSDEEEIRDFLHNFATIPLTSPIAERAVAIRRKRRLKLPDAIIKATAEESARLLITRNTRDFAAASPGVRIPYS
jgi:hypothetical protein